MKTKPKAKRLARQDRERLLNVFAVPSRLRSAPHLYRVRVLVLVERLADLRPVDLDFFSGVSTMDGRHVGKLIGKRRFGLHDVARVQGRDLLNDLTKSIL